jgi:hypothetical protein
MADRRLRMMVQRLHHIGAKSHLTDPAIFAAIQCKKRLCHVQSNTTFVLFNRPGGDRIMPTNRSVS